jgi:putative glutamine amidotransferase
MKISVWFKAGLVSILAAGVLSVSLFSPARSSGNKKSAGAREEITIAVLYPSVGTIKELVGLRKNHLIDIPRLSVIGIYHEKERTDYAEAREFVRANNLDWITFQPLSGPLAEDNLFQHNSCSAEFGRIFKESDGIIFFGGPDIPPVLYREKTNLLTQIEDPYRHFLELSFIFHLLGGYQDETFKPLLESRPQFPVFGICLGCESLNVGTGGTLVQDIWSEIYGQTYVEDVIALGKENWHENPWQRLFPQNDLASYFFHPLKLEPTGKFCASLGFDPQDTPFVRSSHHQMAEKLGKGFHVTATSLDGKVVEALEHERYPNVLGVQFHPEPAELYDPATRVRFTPQDKEPINPRSLLESHPPSLDFHKKLWAWVSQKWTEKHP